MLKQHPKYRASASATLKGTKVKVIKRSEVKHEQRYTVQVRGPLGRWRDCLSHSDWNEVVGYAEAQGAPDEFRIVDNSEAM